MQNKGSKAGNSLLCACVVKCGQKATWQQNLFGEFNVV